MAPPRPSPPFPLEPKAPSPLAPLPPTADSCVKVSLAKLPIAGGDEMKTTLPPRPVPPLPLDELAPPTPRPPAPPWARSPLNELELIDSAPLAAIMSGLRVLSAKSLFDIDVMEHTQPCHLP